MHCPHCDGDDTRVVDTRLSRGGRAVRRRRECIACSGRFTTYEVVEERPIQVLKVDGSSEEYDRSKLVRSLTVASAKRPVSAVEIDHVVEEIEDELSRVAGLEVESGRIAQMVMSRLAPIDRVAYVRYASVYRNFRDLAEFQDFVDDVRARQRREIQERDQVQLPLIEWGAPRDEEEAGEPSG